MGVKWVLHTGTLRQPICPSSHTNPAAAALKPSCCASTLRPCRLLLRPQPALLLLAPCACARLRLPLLVLLPRWQLALSLRVAVLVLRLPGRALLQEERSVLLPLLPPLLPLPPRPSPPTRCHAASMHSSTVVQQSDEKPHHSMQACSDRTCTRQWLNPMPFPALGTVEFHAIEAVRAATRKPELHTPGSQRPAAPPPAPA